MNSLKFATLSALNVKPYALTNKEGETFYVEEAALIRLVSEKLQVPYEVLIPKDEAYGIKLPNGSWTGIMGMLERSEVDLGVGYIGIYDKTPTGVRFIYPHVLSENTFMGNKPEPLTAREGIVYPFSYEVWIMIALSLIVVTLFCYFVMKRKPALLDIFLTLFGSLLEKSFDFKIQTSSFKVFLSSWILAVFVLSSSYKGLLLSFLTFPSLVGIRDIADLSRAAETFSVHCYTYRGTYTAQRLIESSIDSWKAPGECLRRNEMVGVTENDTPEQIFLKATGKKVFITGKTFLKSYEKLYFISKDSFFVEIYFIFYSKTFCCGERLNNLIFRFIAAGLVEKYRRDETFFVEQSAIAQFPESKPPETLRKVQFSDLSGAFIVLLSGWILGFITLLAELAVKKICYLQQSRSKGDRVDASHQTPRFTRASSRPSVIIVNQCDH